MQSAVAFAHEGEAADWLDAALGHLAATDWASLSSTAHGDMLRRLQRAQTRLTAVNAAVLSAFTAGQGYEPDGHGSAVQWLIHRTGISKGAALGAYGWHKRLARHGVIAAAMTDGTVSESWAKAIAGWTDPLPSADRDEADRILLEAAAAGVPLQDLEILARSMSETWKAQHPDPDDGNGDGGDEDGFDDRSLRLGTTFGGAGRLKHKGRTGLGMPELRRRFCLPGTWTFAASGVRFTGARAVPIERYRYRGANIPTPWAPQPEPAAHGS